MSSRSVVGIKQVCQEHPPKDPMADVQATEAVRAAAGDCKGLGTTGFSRRDPKYSASAFGL